VKKSVITCRFPPTDKVSVQWTENMGTNVKVEQKVELSCTVEQRVLMSIGEGMLLVHNLVAYKIISGQMSLFEIEIDPRIKVTNVEPRGKIPVRRWEVVQEEKRKKKKKKKDEKEEKKEEEEDESKEKPKKPILKVWLEYGIEDCFEFTVSAELEMEGTSCKILAPVFNALIGKEVVREKGFIAVEALTNVEIAELECNGLEIVDVSEIPDSLFNSAEYPILFGYKYLYPQYDLVLDVKKHQDVGVLIAVVDSAHYTATYAEEGSVMYKLLLMIKNTQKQYVRVSAPKDAEIWSTLVKGAAVKPAIDDAGRVMVPLEKASRSGSDDQTVQSVEFIYIIKGAELSGRGRLGVSFPSIDIPISRLFVSVFVPSNYIYGEWEGMATVSWWTSAVPTAMTPDTTYSPSVKKEKKKKDRRRYSYDENDDAGGALFDSRSSMNFAVEQVQQLDEKMDYVDKASYQVKTHGWNNKRGVKPVHVEMPTTGNEYKFEELLVTEKELKVKVEYKRQAEKGCGQRRNVDGCC